MKRFEKLIEGGLLACALSSVLVIGAMAFFLFSEGVSLFWYSPLEEYSVLVVNSENPIDEISAYDFNGVKTGAITNWQELGSFAAPSSFFKAKSSKHVDSILQAVAADRGAIATLWKDDATSLPAGVKFVTVPNISLTDFLFGQFWYPTSEPVAQMGILPMILGTILVTIVAILLAVPFSIGCAVYLSEVAKPAVRNAIKPVIEILASIPSVVYGFFGLVVVVPWIRVAFDLDTGESGFAGAVVLALMVIPTIVSISEDAMNGVSQSLRHASLALGATKWQTIAKVVIPSSLSGIITATMLGVGRAIGETMAVLMVTGNAAVIPDGILTSLRTLTATIAAELGEAPHGGLHFKSLFAIGCVLFLFTMAINIIADLTTRKYQTEVNG